MSKPFDRRSPSAAPPRREPLPWEEPKSALDDGRALERVRELLASPTYRQADKDLEFLDSDDTRGVRLQSDYLKAELALRRRGVEHTIVVFGGTRIREPAAAERRVRELGRRASALVAFPGGYGTFDEVFETLTLVQTRTIQPVPVVLVGEEYWRRAVDFDFLVDEGVIEREDRELFRYAESAAEVWQSILAWHERRGSPLVTPCVPQP